MAVEHSMPDICISQSREDRLLITRKGVPVALIVNIEGMDEEQRELGTGDSFGKLIRSRRMKKRITREELEQGIEEDRRG